LFFKVKIYSGTDKLKTTLRQFGRHIYIFQVVLRRRMANQKYLARKDGKPKISGEKNVLDTNLFPNK